MSGGGEKERDRGRENPNQTGLSRTYPTLALGHPVDPKLDIFKFKDINYMKSVMLGSRDVCDRQI